MRMRTRVAIAGAGLAAVLAVAGCSPTTNVTTVTGPAPDTITTSGTGVGKVAPDRADLSFGVTASAPTAPAAMDAATKVTTKIIAALKAAGVADNEIQTQQVSLNKRYDPSGRKVVGYDANQSIGVTTKKIDQVGAYIAAATGAGATDVSGPSLSASPGNSAYPEAIAAAMADAKVHAQAIAKASGRTLGAVVSVAEQGVSNPGPVYGAGLSFGAAKGAVAVPPIQPGQEEVTVSLTVVYRLQ
jgi:uncharacterized protein